jgi:hypothetical protein
MGRGVLAVIGETQMMAPGIVGAARRRLFHLDRGMRKLVEGWADLARES